MASVLNKYCYKSYNILSYAANDLCFINNQTYDDSHGLFSVS